MLILTFISKLDKSVINIAMISVDIYCAASRLKGAQIFAIFIKTLKFQATKKAKPETDLKSVILEEYHNFLHVFSKKNSDTLSPHWKYDNKIILEGDQKHGHAPLYKMSLKEFNTVKCYFNSYLAKEII